MTEVQLQPIDASNWRRTLAIRCGPGQLRFVASYEPVALVILAKSYVRENAPLWHPFAIRDGDLIVGVAALAQDGAICNLLHLLIDRDRQRQGYGRAAMRALIAYARQQLSGTEILELTVHPENRVAQALYASLGFQPTGTMRHEEQLWRLPLV